MPDKDIITQMLLDQNKVMLDIKEDVGAIKNQVSNFAGLDARISTLEAAHNKIKGGARVWAVVASVIVTCLGWVIERHTR